MRSWKGYNILDLLCVFIQAKGKIATQFIGVIYFCFYIAISYSQKYYGEAILYLTIMLPMYIYGVIHWLKNRDEKEEDTVLVRSNLSKKEWVISSICYVFLSIVVFFILKELNTSQLIVSTL